MSSVHQILWLVLLSFVLTLSVPLDSTQDTKKNLTVLYEWTRLDYDYPSPEARQEALANGDLIYGNNIPIDVDVFHGGDNKHTVFMTVPRFTTGIPSTLNTVTDKFLDEEKKRPILAPYPSWEWHTNLRECPKDRIVSVFRVQNDKCNRMWVLDTGRIGSEQICPPQILAFDVVYDLLVYRHEIPQSVLTCNSLLITPVVDMREYCNDVFIYAADVSGYGIIVHDVRKGNTWRVESKSMFPDLNHGSFEIAGDSFEYMDGIFGMAISPYRYGHDRKLYFHSLSSISENWVYTSVLRNESSASNIEEVKKQFHTFPQEKESQSAAEAMDDKGIMYFGSLSETSIKCWNSRTEFDQENFDTLERNVDTLQFPSAVKIVNNNNGGPQELWISTCRFQKIVTGTMDFENDINFRIQFVDVVSFIKNSKCYNGTADRTRFWRLCNNYC